MEDQKNTTEQLPEVQPQTMEDILKAYAGRDINRIGVARKQNPRSIDRFPNHQLGNYKVYNPEEEAPKIITSEIVKQHLHTSFALYKKTKQIPQLIFHPENLKTIENVILYLAGEEGSFDLKKGLFFYGPIGNGKTDFCLIFTQMINVLSRTYSNAKRYKILSYDAIYNQVREKGNIHPITQSLSGNVYMDDLLYQGRNEALIYGNKDFVADIMITNLDKLHDLGYTHIITSNYPFDGPAESLSKELHPTSMDRMKKMFNIIYWQGKSLR